MPLFAYVCKTCNTSAELLVRSNEQVVCPSCGSRKMERQMSRITPRRNTAPQPCCSGCSMAGGECCPSGTGCMS